MINNITQIAKDTLISALKEPTRIELKRTYLPEVTLGELKGFINGKKVVETKTIELKWKNNIKRESCISENIILLNQLFGINITKKYQEFLMLKIEARY